MKITQTPPVHVEKDASQVKHKEKAEHTPFQQLLSEASEVGKAAAPGVGQTADPLAALEGAGKVNRSQALVAGGTEVEFRRVQTAVDLLHVYQQQLENPSISLKQMMPVVRSLETEIQSLVQLRDQENLPADLARIASEVAVTAQVEVSKFHRGDYV